mgnify:CR=1 FL=1
MKIARLRNKGELELKNEIIEYPPELEGNRNLMTRESVMSYNGSPVLPEDGFYLANEGMYGGLIFNKATIKDGQTYTISFKYKTTDNAGWYTIAPKNAALPAKYGSNIKLNLINNGEINTHSITFTATADEEIAICLLRERDSGTVSYMVNSLKIEKGTVVTPWTPAPEDLGLDYPDFIKKFNQKIYPNGVILTPEIIEFPIELVGKRNLFSGEFYRDINNYDDVLVYRYHLTNRVSNKMYAVRAWVKDGETATSNFWITLTSGHPNPNSASANGGTYTHIISGGNPMESQVLARNNVPVYISYYPPSTDPSVLDKYHISIQQLDSGNISDWTPAPEDLGLEYSSDMQYFNIRVKDNMLMVTELIEGDA